MKKNSGKLFSLEAAFDNSAQLPYHMNGCRPIRKEIKDLSEVEIPYELKSTMKTPLSPPQISKRIKRVVESQDDGREKNKKKFTEVPDLFTTRIFKEYLYDNNIYTITSLDNIPRVENTHYINEETKEFVNNGKKETNEN